MKDKLSDLFGFLAKIAAVLLVLALLLHYININFGYFMGELGSNILNGIKEYGLAILAALVALSAIFKLHPILIIILGLVLIAVAVFMFLPGATDAIFGAVKGA